MRRALTLAVLLFGLVTTAAAQTKDSLVKTDTTFGPVLIRQTYLRVSVPVVPPKPPVDTVKPVPPVQTGAITFEDGTFGGLTDGGGGKPVGASIFTGSCYSGLKCMDVSLPASGSDQGGSAYWVGKPSSDLWVSFALNVLQSPTSGGVETQKMLIFKSPGNAPNQWGEMNQAYGGWIWSWLFTFSGPNYPLKLGSATVTGWHTYRVHLHCAAPASVTFGKDGADVQTLTTTKGCGVLPSMVTFGGTLNASSGASHFRFDNITVSATDPGFP